MKLLTTLPFFVRASKYEGHHLVEITVDHLNSDSRNFLENFEKNENVQFMEPIEDFDDGKQAPGWNKLYSYILKRFFIFSWKFPCIKILSISRKTKLKVIVDSENFQTIFDSLSEFAPRHLFENIQDLIGTTFYNKIKYYYIYNLLLYWIIIKYS